MKITAKPGSQLETIFKQFYEQMENEKNQVFKMVEEFTGVKPINFGYYWYFGITCVWAEDTWRFADLISPKNVVPYTVRGRTYFKPNRLSRKMIIPALNLSSKVSTKSKNWCLTAKQMPATTNDWS
jgi:hypothetical protein